MFDIPYLFALNNIYQITGDLDNGDQLQDGKFYMVKWGLPFHQARINIGGTIVGVGVNGSTTGPITLGGVTVDLGTGSGSVTLPDEKVIAVNSSGAITVDGDPVSGTVNLGAGITLQIGSGGGTLTIPGGPTIHVNPDRSGSIMLPNGYGITISADNKVGFVLPPGTPQIIVDVVNTAGKILQSQNGVVISVRDLLGAISTMPSSGAIADIDVGITSQGKFQIGIDTGDGPIWFDVTKKPTVEFIRDGDDDHTIDGADPTIAFALIGHWGADREDGGVTGYESGTYGLILNDAVPNNFVDKDPERFYVRVKDPNANQNITERDTITVKIGTLLDNGSLDDDMTEITLKETANSSGVFVSEAHLLVMPDVTYEAAILTSADDDLFVTTNMDPSGPNIQIDDLENDRTHRATVDGSVRATYESGDTHSATIPVNQRSPDERRILNVVVHTFNEPYQDTNGNGQFDAGEPFIDISLDDNFLSVNFSSSNPENRGAIWSETDVTAAIAFLKASLTQAGIRVVVSRPPARDPIGNLFAQPGSETVSPSYGKLAVGSLVVVSDPVLGQGFLSRDFALIQNHCRSPQNQNGTDTDDVLDLYMVPPFRGTTTEGMAMTPKFVAAYESPQYNPTLPASFSNQAFITLEGARTPRTMAHEVMHLLTNQSDAPENAQPPAHIFFPQNRTFELDGSDPRYGRRLQQQTINSARTTRPANDQTAVGNRVLRTP